MNDTRQVIYLVNTVPLRGHLTLEMDADAAEKWMGTLYCVSNGHKIGARVWVQWFAEVDDGDNKGEGIDTLPLKCE